MSAEVFISCCSQVVCAHALGRASAAAPRVSERSPDVQHIRVRPLLADVDGALLSEQGPSQVLSGSVFISVVS